MGELTKRERILRTLRREGADRVPISTYEMVGFNFDSWYNNQPSYARLMEFIREKTDCLYSCGYSFSNAAEGNRRSEEVWEEDSYRFKRVTLHTPKGDLTGLYRDQEDLHTTWCLEHFVKDTDDLDKWLSIPYEPGDVAVDNIRKADEVVGDNGVPIVETGDPILVVAELFSFEDFLLNRLTDRKKIIYAMDVIFERQYNDLEKALKLGAGPAFRLVGPEYATPPYVPPDDFRELVVKYDGRFIELVHRYGGFVRLHCHGRVREVLPMFVEMGADGTDPIEAPPSGDIELAEAKRLYGKDIVFFGNMQLRDLEYLSTREIDDLGKKAMQAAMEGGG